jgi:serine/threonine-protein kinase
MVAGEVPFSADTFMGTLTKHMFETPVPPRKLRPDLGIPEHLEQVILRALAKNPDDRFQSMGEISAQLLASETPSGSRALLTLAPTSQIADDTEVSPGPPAAFILDGDEEPLTLGSPRRIPLTGALPHIAEDRGKRLIMAAAAGTVLVGGVIALVIYLVQPSESPSSQNESREPDLTIGKTITVAPRLPKDAGVRVAPDTLRLVRIVLHSTPAGAMVVGGGRELGKTPLTVQLQTGAQVTYVFKKQGYRAETYALVVPDQDHELKINLRSRARSGLRDKGSPSLKELRTPPEFNHLRRRRDPAP